MPKPLTWLSPSDPAFPSSLVRHLGDKSPKRIAAIGNLDLVHSNEVALICSVKCPGTIILQTYDIAWELREAGVSVIGGFHSPMERECLRILLRGNQPLIICPARSLEGIRLPKEYKKPDQLKIWWRTLMPKEIDEDEPCRYWSAKWATPLFDKEGLGEIFPLPLESQQGLFTHHSASNPPKPPFAKGGIDWHGLPSKPRY